MNALKLLVALAACVIVPQALADPFPCPDMGDPGYIGIDSASVFLDFDPSAPNSSQGIVLSTGKVAFVPDNVSTQIVGTTIDILLGGHDDQSETPPPVQCLSDSIGPLAAGSYAVRVIVIPDDPGNTPPYVAALSSLDVTEAQPGDNVPLPINGQMTSNWYDPAHSGEGIIVQVAAYPPTTDGTVFKALVFDWFTFDTSGNPFWISGNATIDPANPTSVTVPAIYSVDGGFAGDFGANATQVPWGTLTFSFPDLNHMTVDYDAPPQPDATNVPTGTGTLHY
ncbi:MAG: hypothetical protein WBW61_08920, partial [Rhodanobacteraceae bacterium]